MGNFKASLCKLACTFAELLFCSVNYCNVSMVSVTNIIIAKIKRIGIFRQIAT